MYAIWSSYEAEGTSVPHCARSCTHSCALNVLDEWMERSIGNVESRDKVMKSILYSTVHDSNPEQNLTQLSYIYFSKTTYLNWHRSLFGHS